MKAVYQDINGTVEKEWSLRSLTGNSIRNRIKKDWEEVSTQLKAYFGETRITVTNGESLIADGIITSNVFAGHVGLNIQVYKQPNRLAV